MVGCDRADPLHDRIVGGGGRIGEPTGHHDDVGRGDLGERRGRDECESTGVVDHRTRLLGDEDALDPGEVGQRLERTDDVEGGELWVERQSNLHEAILGPTRG